MHIHHRACTTYRSKTKLSITRASHGSDSASCRTANILSVTFIVVVTLKEVIITQHLSGTVTLIFTLAMIDNLPGSSPEGRGFEPHYRHTKKLGAQQKVITMVGEG